MTAFTKSEGLPFEAWRKILDAQVRRRIAVGLDDLPDQPFRVWYDDDLAPADVLDEVLDSV